MAWFNRYATDSLCSFSCWLGIWILIITFSTNVQAQTPPSTQQPVRNSSLSAAENFQQGNLTRAIQQWSRDIKNRTNVVEALYNRSQAYILLKQYDFAVQDLNQIIQIQGKNTPVYVLIVRGIALTELNQLPEAIQSFNQAEKLQPSSLVYNNRALAYQRSGQMPQALEDLQKSVQLAPTLVNRLNLANLRIQLGQFKQVIEEMNQLIATEKSFFPAYLARGIAYYNLGQYENAIRDFILSLKIFPDQPEAYYYAGLSFAKLNRKEDASQNLIRSADLYLQHNQPNNYRQVLEKINELNLQ
ncbi:tetratricopeptide repeat protein [Nostoc sp. FACHB-152]|uniref:tetratricopeptide repeat protein n=1 Tax=unclassified Nostoc TaxID=2593658 RepID=UPI00168990DF|nr:MULTISPECIES: tetratricopeptide repeat protein [unclassified Nostoc]MBD2449349.1 tetratricopeptide repeat protein [Nostoc sp. FACHB-152]MBD2470483.1 tetratricopeptide repeat protein [Nostoc sp. FACHB-145]